MRTPILLACLCLAGCDVQPPVTAQDGTTVKLQLQRWRTSDSDVEVWALPDTRTCVLVIDRGIGNASRIAATPVPCPSTFTVTP